MKFLAAVVGLVVLWLLAWGTVDPAKVLIGVVLAVVILVAMPSRHHFSSQVRVRPLGVARLVAHIVVSLITSSIAVTWEIITPRRRVRNGVLIYPMDGAPPEVVSLLANMIALTPDTVTVDAHTDPAMVEVHFLDFGDPAKALDTIIRLDTVVRAALGVDPPPDHDRVRR